MTAPEPYTPDELDALTEWLRLPHEQRHRPTVAVRLMSHHEPQCCVCRTPWPCVPGTLIDPFVGMSDDDAHRLIATVRAAWAERDEALRRWEHEDYMCSEEAALTRVIAAKDAEIARLRAAGQRLYDYAVALDCATEGYFLSRSFAGRPEGGREAGNTWRAVVPQPRAKDADHDALSAPGDADQGAGT